MAIKCRSPLTNNDLKLEFLGGGCFEELLSGDEK
jgi:hypothetical protein